MKVKLINLNTWWGGMHLWDNMVDYLVAEQPDILMLEEVFSDGKILQTGSSDEPFLNTAKSLQRVLNLPYLEFAEECQLENGTVSSRMGNAILSKFELKNPTTTWIHGTGSKVVDDRDRSMVPEMPRNLLHCQTEINSLTYNLMVTHGVWAPDHNETDLQKQMGKKIASYITGKPNTILCGDFNINENTESIKLIEQQLKNIFKNQRVSSFNMKQKTNPGYATAIVDFVFSSPEIKMLEHYSAEANVSDHQSQIVVFEL